MRRLSTLQRGIPPSGIILRTIGAKAVTGGGTAPPTYFGSAAPTGCSDGSCAVTDANSPVSITPPASMVAGDLVFVVAALRRTSTANFTVSTDGGQSWTSESVINANPSFLVIHWCTFDGTWDSTPAFAVDSADGSGYIALMHVFRPGSTPHTWAKDTGPGYENFTLPSDPYDVTATEITIAHTNSVALFTFITTDDDSWALQTAGWTATNFDAGVYYILNTGGNDHGIQTVFKIFTTTGGTGTVTSRIGGSPSAGGTILKISFY